MLACELRSVTDTAEGGFGPQFKALDLGNHSELYMHEVVKPSPRYARGTQTRFIVTWIRTFISVLPLYRQMLANITIYIGS